MIALSGRVAVITGAASGIGRATALALAEQGCALALVDIDPDGLGETGRAAAACGVHVTTHVVDVSDRASMARLPEAVAAEHGHVHVLVNNAGVSVTDWFCEADLDDFAWAMGVNFWGMVHGCRFFLPYLAREPEAHIVNVASSWSLIGLPTQTAYCASKYAARGFTEALIADLYGTSVFVTLVHPGSVATNIVKNSRMRDPEFKATVARNIESALPPRRAALAIVRAIKRRSRRVLIGKDAVLIDVLARLMPVPGTIVARHPTIGAPPGTKMPARPPLVRELHGRS